MASVAACGGSTDDPSAEDTRPDPFASASMQAAAIRDGVFSSSELLELYLIRGDEQHDALNAIVARDVEGARARAREADDALARGEIWGPCTACPAR